MLFRSAELAKARAGGDAAPQPAQAAPQTPIAEVLKQAEAAEDARDYKKAFPLYLDAAKRGNAIGQFNVGYFYR